jgi:DNA-binding transcriptional regulator YhcF (GntR family)
VTPVNDSGPIFVQIADELADQVADGGLAEDERIPSANELAAFYRVNPATAARALTVLVEEGLAHKRRGVGMFVASGARDRLIHRRRRQFADKYIRPMVAEATRLGLDQDELVTLVHGELASATVPTGGKS